MTREGLSTPLCSACFGVPTSVHVYQIEYKKIDSSQQSNRIAADVAHLMSNAKGVEAFPVLCLSSPCFLFSPQRHY